MTGHAVVVIEEAVADENFGLREVGAKARDNRFGLRQRRRRPGRDPAGRRQYNEKPSENSGHTRSPCLALFCDSVSRRAALSHYLGWPAPARPRMSLCTRETKGYLPALAYADGRPQQSCDQPDHRLGLTGATA